MVPLKFCVGQSVLREDDALIRGRYTDDHAPQTLHALMLRSPHAHATFTFDVTLASALPRLAAILTTENVRDLSGLASLFNLEDHPITGPDYPILAAEDLDFSNDRRLGRHHVDRLLVADRHVAGMLVPDFRRILLHRNSQDR